MARRFEMVKLLTMALVAIVAVGVLTPLCTMPGCDDVSAGTCSDFQSACDGYPNAVVMKHTQDDAVSVTAPTIAEPAVVAVATMLPEPTVLSPALAVPEATGSSPPLDPLGVRLTV